MGRGLARNATEGGMSFTPPNLAEMISRYQAFLQPEDPRFGDGIAEWAISSEYDNNPMSENDGAPIWGCMCSPSVLSSEGVRVKLQPEDIAAKRAHIVVRTPQSREDLIEVERTVLHELGHVLHAKLNLPRDAEEEIMHSLDHFFYKMDPQRAAMIRAMEDPDASIFTGLADELEINAWRMKIVLQSFQNPMARAYRAKETAMPDPIEENKEKPDKAAPAMQEGGGPRDVATIQGDIAKAALAGQPVDELAKELALALVAAGSAAGNGPASTAEPAPVAPPTMGMKPEEAYARQAAADRKEAIEAILDANPHLDDKQKAMARKMPSVKDARELVASYPRAANHEPARMGLTANPKTDPRASLKPMARAIATARDNPTLRRIAGIGSLEADGIHYEPQPGVLFYVDGTEQLNHQRATLDAKRAERRGAA